MKAQLYFSNQRKIMYRRVTAQIPFVMGLLIALTLILTACGSNNTTTGGQSDGTPPAQVQKCGSVETSPNGLITEVTKVKQAENCFWQAYQQCHAATLNFTRR